MSGLNVIHLLRPCQCAMAALALLLFSPQQADASPQAEVTPQGIIQLDGLTIDFGHFSKNWEHSRNILVAGGYPQKDEVTGTVSVKGQLVLKALGERLNMDYNLANVENEAWVLNADISNDAGVQTNEISMQVRVPAATAAGRAVWVDGVEYPLPTEVGESTLFTLPEGAHRLLVPSNSGSIEIDGNFGITAVDNRNWGDTGYVLRLRRQPAGKILVKETLAANIAQRPWSSEPVNLATTVNRAFVDEIANDGKGGWTDQGPENDLSSVVPGELTISGITFDILNPENNAGLGALVFNKEGRIAEPPLAASVTIPVAGSPTWKNLYLLHGTAWTPSMGTLVGSITAHYEDGSHSTAEVISHRDVGDWWWISHEGENAVVGWLGENDESLVGLFVSRFALEDKPLKSLTIDATGAASWMIVGISGSGDDIPIHGIKVPSVIRADADWAPFEHSLRITPGSVFDFSFLSDAPAGKYGHVAVGESGHLEFVQRPGQRVRFWGVNLCYTANFLSKEEADLLAETLVRSGYNSVRFHHFDNMLVQRGANNSHELNPEALDQINYLFAALKKRGIYINIDLFASRRFTPEEIKAFGLPATITGSESQSVFKALVAISDAAFESWANFADNLLLQRNPYTGLTWAEDPALIGICTINEVAIHHVAPSNVFIRDTFEEAFRGWLALPENAQAAQEAGQSGRNYDLAYTRWLYETQMDMDKRLAAHLHSIGVKAPITGVNYISTLGLSFLRDGYDYVDNHAYWDHPRFPQTRWRLPYSYHQRSATVAEASVPRSSMPSRIFQKPFAMTEFNYVNPNRYRAEGGVLMPAYASLQDWDALYNFEYATTRAAAVNGAVGNSFSIANDPIGLIADRLSALIFLREDIQPANRRITYAVEEDEAYSDRQKRYPVYFSRLGLLSQIGSQVGSPTVIQKQGGFDAVISGIAEENRADGIYSAQPDLIEKLLEDAVLPQGSVDLDAKRFRSDTGEIELAANAGTLRVVTPMSELFVLPEHAELEGGNVSVRNGETFATVSVIAVDGKPIAQSERLLVAHLTDASYTGMTFDSKEHLLLESWGKKPHLARRGATQIRLNLGNGQWRAWAVDITGTRRSEVQLRRDGEAWVLDATTVDAAGKSGFAYELSRLVSEN